MSLNWIQFLREYDGTAKKFSSISPPNGNVCNCLPGSSLDKDIDQEIYFGDVNIPSTSQQNKHSSAVCETECGFCEKRIPSEILSPGLARMVESPVENESVSMDSNETEPEGSSSCESDSETHTESMGTSSETITEDSVDTNSGPPPPPNSTPTERNQHYRIFAECDLYPGQLCIWNSDVFLTPDQIRQEGCKHRRGASSATSAGSGKVPSSDQSPTSSQKSFSAEVPYFSKPKSITPPNHPFRIGYRPRHRWRIGFEPPTFYRFFLRFLMSRRKSKQLYSDAQNFAGEYTSIHELCSHKAEMNPRSFHKLASFALENRLDIIANRPRRKIFTKTAKKSVLRNQLVRRFFKTQIAKKSMIESLKISANGVKKAIVELRRMYPSTYKDKEITAKLIRATIREDFTRRYNKFIERMAKVSNFDPETGKLIPIVVPIDKRQRKRRRKRNLRKTTTNQVDRANSPAGKEATGKLERNNENHREISMDVNGEGSSIQRTLPDIEAKMRNFTFPIPSIELLESDRVKSAIEMANNTLKMASKSPLDYLTPAIPTDPRQLQMQIAALNGIMQSRLNLKNYFIPRRSQEQSVKKMSTQKKLHPTSSSTYRHPLQTYLEACAQQTIRSVPKNATNHSALIDVTPLPPNLSCSTSQNLTTEETRPLPVISETMNMDINIDNKTQSSNSSTRNLVETPKEVQSNEISPRNVVKNWRKSLREIYEHEQRLEESQGKEQQKQIEGNIAYSSTHVQSCLDTLSYSSVTTAPNLTSFNQGEISRPEQISVDGQDTMNISLSDTQIANEAENSEEIIRHSLLSAMNSNPIIDSEMQAVDNFVTNYLKRRRAGETIINHQEQSGFSRIPLSAFKPYAPIVVTPSNHLTLDNDRSTESEEDIDAINISSSNSSSNGTCSDLDSIELETRPNSRGVLENISHRPEGAASCRNIDDIEISSCHNQTDESCGNFDDLISLIDEEEVAVDARSVASMETCCDIDVYSMEENDEESMSEIASSCANIDDVISLSSRSTEIDSCANIDDLFDEFSSEHESLSLSDECGNIDDINIDEKIESSSSCEDIDEERINTPIKFHSSLSQNELARRPIGSPVDDSINMTPSTSTTKQWEQPPELPTSIETNENRLPFEGREEQNSQSKKKTISDIEALGLAMSDSSDTGSISEADTTNYTIDSFLSSVSSSSSPDIVRPEQSSTDQANSGQQEIVVVESTGTSVASPCLQVESVSPNEQFQLEQSTSPTTAPLPSSPFRTAFDDHTYLTSWKIASTKLAATAAKYPVNSIQGFAPKTTKIALPKWESVCMPSTSKATSISFHTNLAQPQFSLPSSLSIQYKTDEKIKREKFELEKIHKQRPPSIRTESEAIVSKDTIKQSAQGKSKNNEEFMKLWLRSEHRQGQDNPLSKSTEKEILRTATINDLFPPVNISTTSKNTALDERSEKRKVGRMNLLRIISQKESKKGEREKINNRNLIHKEMPGVLICAEEKNSVEENIKRSYGSVGKVIKDIRTPEDAKNYRGLANVNPDLYAEMLKNAKEISVEKMGDCVEKKYKCLSGETIVTRYAQGKIFSHTIIHPSKM